MSKENENLLPVNYPEKSGEYKVVLFEGETGIILRFGRERDFHEFILRRFAQEIGVECTQITGPDEPVDALPAGAPFRMSGAGTCTIDLDHKTAKFSGRSHDYSIGINQEQLDRLKERFPDWQIE